MTILPLGPWEPDSSGVAVPSGEPVALQVAKNVYPLKTGYGPIPALSAIGALAIPGGETCVGFTFARATTGGYILFAGTPTKLYKYDTSSATPAWTNVSRLVGGNYNVASGDYWSFAQYGTTLIACNIQDVVQSISVDVALNFAALAGSPPQSRYVSVVGDFVVLASQSTNTRKVRNSAINDSTGWTVGTNLCDEQEFADGGRVTGIAGGEFGYVLQETSIRRMIFQPGSDTAFRFERVEKEHGCAAGYGVVATVNSVFFISNDGFYSFGANGLVPIGAGRINKWFRANSDTARFFSVIAFTDPYAPRIYWAFFSAVSATTFDRLIIYDWQLDRWSYSEASAMFWATSVTAALTLEGLDTPYPDIDTLVPYSLDSRVWEGGRPVIAAISTSGLLSFLEASVPLDAILTTAPLRLNPSARANVGSVEPLGIFSGATLSIRIGRRERTQDAASYTAAITPSTLSGIARMKASGRFHEIETTITQTSGTLWTHCQGLDIGATPDGKK